MNLTGQGVYQRGKPKKKLKGDRSNWERIRALGCIICGTSNPHLHHALTGSGRRKDDTKVLPLCYFHHQGEQGIHTLGRKVWQALYGTETELLDKVDKLIASNIDFPPALKL